MKPGLYRRSGVFLLILAVVGLLLAARPGWAFDFTQRSISRSAQFIIFSPDIHLRLAVSGFAETAKQDVLETLGLGDHWKFPIVIQLRRPASTDPVGALSEVRLIQTEGGWQIQVDVTLREGELKQVRFPQLIVRAILLEIAYREHPPEIGVAYTEPPSWLVEGLTQKIQANASGSVPNAEIFQQLIDNGQLPKIQDFLRENVAVMDPTSLAIYDSCASSLLNLLASDTPGKAALLRLVKGLRESDGDPLAQISKNFPTLAATEADLEKWWTLGLARGSILNRNYTLSVPETNTRLTPLLQLTVVTDEKKKTSEEFALADFRNFMKYPAAKAALMTRSSELTELLIQAHPLLRPVLLEYLRVVTGLVGGEKPRHIDEALAAAARYRELIVERMGNIEDYLNWYEATQMPQQSGAFEDFLQGSKALEKAAPPKRNDPISNYIDQLQREFE